RELENLNLLRARNKLGFAARRRRGSQVVRHGSAKAAFVGSIPTSASIITSAYFGFRICGNPEQKSIFETASVENRPSPQRHTGCAALRCCSTLPLIDLLSRRER